MLFALPYSLKLFEDVTLNTRCIRKLNVGSRNASYREDESSFLIPLKIMRNLRPPDSLAQEMGSENSHFVLF
jgi:hypothetical protein